MLLEPRCPRAPHVTGQHQVRPQLDQMVDVDEPTHVVLGAFCQYLFVDECPISALIKVVSTQWTAPTDAQRQHHDSSGPWHISSVEVIRNRDRTCRRAQHGTARVLKPGHEHKRRRPPRSSAAMTMRPATPPASDSTTEPTPDTACAHTAGSSSVCIEPGVTDAGRCCLPTQCRVVSAAGDEGDHGVCGVTVEVLSKSVVDRGGRGSEWRAARGPHPQTASVASPRRAAADRFAVDGPRACA